MRRPYIVGLTGPTGAGKSTAAAAFRRAGFFHIDADTSARLTTEAGSPLLTVLAENFGHDILTGGELNRKLLAERAFSSPEKTELLNRLSFPFIIETIGEQIADAAQAHDHILLDAPTLFESGSDRICDTTVAVLCGETARLARIITRDGLSQCSARLRIDAGKPDAFYLERCAHIIYNNGSLEEFSAHIEAAIEKILRESRVT